MYVQDAPVQRVERVEIAQPLRELERPERKRLPGDRRVDARLGGNQQKDAGVWPAFVKLSGRVQISRTVAEHRRGARPIADRHAKPEQLVGDCLLRTDVREEAD